MKKNLGILVFNDVEILDFAGPYEVFSSTRLTSQVLNKNNLLNIYKRNSPLNIFTISLKKKIITYGGLKVITDYSLSNSPKLDILLIPGGIGTRILLKNKRIISWINSKKNLDFIISVCTGSLLLAKAGLLKNRRATTHWGATEFLKKISPTTHVIKKRYVASDNIYTSSGVSSGIDLSLYIVEKLYGEKIAKNTAKYMEYKLLKKK